MLLVPGWRLPGERRSATYAAQSRLKPAGTKAALSTPMSPPAGNGDRAMSLVFPPGPIAQTRPVVSSGATRSPPKEPNDNGATAIPPSTLGACEAIVVTRPAQSTPKTVVPPRAVAVTRRR